MIHTRWFKGRIPLASTEKRIFGRFAAVVGEMRLLHVQVVIISWECCVSTQGTRSGTYSSINIRDEESVQQAVTSYALQPPRHVAPSPPTTTEVHELSPMYVQNYEYACNLNNDWQRPWISKSIDYIGVDNKGHNSVCSTPHPDVTLTEHDPIN